MTAEWYNIYIVFDRRSFDLRGAARLPEGPARTAAVAAWIQSLYETRPPVLVGGAAVELYTGGAYTTGDFDFIGDVPDSVGEALKQAGFKREGRHWIHSEAELYVEFPGSAVQPHERAAKVKFGKVSVLVLSPEDMIVDRLAAWQFWNSTTDGASAFLLWKAQEKKLSRKRLGTLARKRGVEKAFDRLTEFVRGKAARMPSEAELEQWARRRP